MNKLVLIDGHAIMYRAFHAMPPLTTKSGDQINAVYGLISMLIKVIDDLKPTHIAVCFDEKAKTFRQKEFSDYQAQRPSMPPELDSQFDLAKDFLKAARINVYSKEGFEADDVIGTIAKKFDKDVVIVTGDRDMLQLVDKKIKLYMPIAGLSNAKLFGDEETIERMGVSPKLIPDYKGLVGDSSDNYFGVPGVGPKTAINLLNQFGNFEGVFKNLSKVPEKLKDKLEKGKDSGFLSYKLATIITEVPIEIDFDQMSKWDLDSSEVLQLFSEFGFKTLTERIKRIGKKIDEEKQGNLF